MIGFLSLVGGVKNWSVLDLLVQAPVMVCLNSRLSVFEHTVNPEVGPLNMEDLGFSERITKRYDNGISHF